MDEAFREDFRRCAFAYTLRVQRNMKITDIASRYGVSIHFAKTMIERGRLCQGRVVEEFGDDTPIEHVPLPIAVSRTLIRMGVKTVREARRIDDDDFRRSGKCGPGGLQTLREVLASRASRDNRKGHDT